MKTKTILKTLAVALLMPAMLLTSACSNQDDVVNNTAENTVTNKGYALPVTVNVTRQGDGTRATYNESTRKLEFSTGDKLFVMGSHAQAGKFAGLLEWQSGGTFSGTIMTQNAYSDTAGALLAAASSPFAALVPAGYDNYNFFTIYGEGTYNAVLSTAMNKTFALTKKDAVEQFSQETATSYSSGFALAPKNGIASFTISGLTASTEVTVVFSDGYNSITKNVTTNASGVATFAVGMYDEANINDYSLTVDGNNITMPTKTVEAGHIYNISRSVAAAPAVPTGAISGQFSVASGKKVYFSKGNLQAKIANYNSTTKAATASEWKFADSQYSTIGKAPGNTTFATGTWVDLFSWVGNSATYDTYGLITFTSSKQANHGNVSGESLKTDWGKLAISNGGNAANSGWRTLSRAEWVYLFNTRTVKGGKGSGKSYTLGQKVNDVLGVVLYPDDYTGAEYTTGSNWSTFESAGCVFLPAAGYREGTSVDYVGSNCWYWSGTADTGARAFRVSFSSGGGDPQNSTDRYNGYSVRLVRDVQ